MNQINRIKQLTQLLNEYRDSYYNNSISKVSDREYDILFDELKKLEEETNIVMTNSPTHTVGYEVKSELKKVKHSHPMLSLDKTKSVDELKKFVGDKDCLLMCKMDGLSILLSYENGELIKAETRGNGEVGEDITHNAKVFENIPLHIKYKEHLEIEGEAIITYDDFQKINDSLPGDKKYANPRNLASGSVRQLDSAIAAERHIKFIVWKMPGEEESFLGGFHGARFLGFDVVPYTYMLGTANNYENHIEYLKKVAEEKNYPIDGLVASFEDIAYGKSLGTTGHHPKHSLAFKFYDDIYPAKLLDIEFTMGKTGILTPTAVFEPIEIEGTIVERASLHNLSIMKELGISHKGQIVNVYKANMIIPQIDSVEKDNILITDENKITIPETCPLCDGYTKIVKENESEILTCANPDCKGKLLGKLSHFVSKNAINIEGLSEQTLQKFIDFGWITNFIDIYKLSKYAEEMSKLDGFGKRSASKLISAIENSRKTTLSRFIYALSIPLIGKSASKTISKYFKDSYEEFIKAWSCGFGFFWTQLNDFGKSMHTSMANYYLDNYDMIKELRKEFYFESNDNSKSNIDLSGKTFVVTGALSYYKNRDELINSIEQLNGKVSGSVSKKTSYLINNDVNSKSGKNKKAIDLGIPIISEKDFVNMIS